MNKLAWRPLIRLTNARAPEPHEIAPVPIVGDGAIATEQVLGGRLVPVLILDTSQRPDVAELVRVHQFLPPGDVTSVWGYRSVRARTVLLVLDFLRPSELKVLLKFDIAGQGKLVDFILDARAVCLQDGIPGDRLLTTMDHDRMIVEVTASPPRWDKLLTRELKRDSRRKGSTRQQASEAAERTIGEWRHLQKLRIKPPGTG